METPIFHLEKVVKAKSEDMEDFTGPLDLILSLLSKNRMEIKDIQIAVILEQYMTWMARRKQLDLEVASEFVTMAAQLVFIKTRMLLSINDEEALSEMEQLIASLEEHQRHENFTRIKGVIPELSDRFAIGRDYITKVPEAIPVNRSYRYHHKAEDLRRAMLSVMERTDHRLPPPMAAFEGIVGREPYPVSDKAGEIVQRLVRFGVTRFRALFQGNRSRSEIVATFIAVLELCKAKKIRLAGTESDCTVTCTTGEAEPDFEFSTDVV
ncbi:MULTISPECIES: segregation and condensation protein A [Oscillospiraceae]|uniref:Segregation and condensation protein A n=1 Tax=Lawsonibacter faecis TaxID=2763052 RepID=A0A8J6MDQ6_9FIRM|nr:MULTISPECIES: segregation/condensation protein A [Oscillospiraceae]MTQ97412.1 chromosome segregation protein ScpA [Pseudoflavonifractor sp. BIOML-A16]MTR06442.1 chromosome segregation protein ScpA [Pseudoflavonifractor sp. BIOML-A15]MTR31717.1 chromosome segregation protein ScpA [Pseudoflavonifractor sp. BIOML-A14]MTR72403.1 chromosome segregation protein ScpA [Pseudoflavonifractor sp. BIOML-A18]MTS64289.1 chromosome segregation protein ScpA [Pseudoflavonifractor sp. BIOML-A5]MTS70805.1 ch